MDLIHKALCRSGCSAAHIKNVPGRKTDVNDATWIADLLALDLIRARRVPESLRVPLGELAVRLPSEPLHASSIISARTRLLPALLMP